MDVTTPLGQLEAGRLRTELEYKHDKRIKYRQLIGYSPEQIGSRFGIRPREVAEMAGRENNDSPKQKG
jgi:hypothetical protein